MIENEYKYNKRFRDYVDKYYRTYRLTVEEALQHEIVKQACKYYTEV